MGDEDCVGTSGAIVSPDDVVVPDDVCEPESASKDSEMVCDL